MLGLMQDSPLLLSSLLEYAETYHPSSTIVSVTCEGDVVRSSYAGIGTRARKLAKALKGLGVQPGDRVATLAWNTHRHLKHNIAVSGGGAGRRAGGPRRGAGRGGDGRGRAEAGGGGF